LAGVGFDALLTRVSSAANADDNNAPQPYPILDPVTAAAIDLGKSVFETQWTSAGASRSDARVGLGPLFNAASCNTCHFQGGHGEGPISDGPTPVALVIQLDSPGKDGKLLPTGDPTYGRVFTTSAIAGVMREGRVAVRYSEIRGYYYPFGPQWTMRIPHYTLVDLNYGPLAPTTVIKPRLAPPLYGLGLLEAVPEDAIVHPSAARTGAARYGTPAWQLREGKRALGWGLNHRMKTEINPTFMHHGRARTTEEAVLWHSGEASSARFRFEKLGPNARDALLRWIEAL
jgi:CxxC motif-containing protein (DUF1111 family)